MHARLWRRLTRAAHLARKATVAGATWRGTVDVSTSRAHRKVHRVCNAACETHLPRDRGGREPSSGERLMGMVARLGRVVELGGRVVSEQSLKVLVAATVCSRVRCRLDGMDEGGRPRNRPVGPSCDPRRRPSRAHCRSPRRPITSIHRDVAPVFTRLPRRGHPLAPDPIIVPPSQFRVAWLDRQLHPAPSPPQQAHRGPCRTEETTSCRTAVYIEAHRALHCPAEPASFPCICLRRRAVQSNLAIDWRPLREKLEALTAYARAGASGDGVVVIA